MFNNTTVGDKVLISTSDWFYAPDGNTYKAVFGTLKSIVPAQEGLGIKPNVRHANWFIQVGNISIAGCQVNYCIKTHNFNPGLVRTKVWHEATGDYKTVSKESAIYNADESYKP